MVELKNIIAGYGKKNVLNEITLSFDKGKIISIIGRNGCGKSTLLKVISGQLPFTKGELFIYQKDLKKYESKELAKKVSFLPQTRTIPKISVNELVLYGRYPYLSIFRKESEKDKEIAENVMKTIGIFEYRDKFICELSGGERQKAFIAMVLAQDTDLVLLDEPTTYLDINHQLEVLSIIEKLKELGKTVILVNHDIETALSFSDKVCLMNQGRVVIYDSPKIVYESKEIENVFQVTCKPLSKDMKNFAFSIK